MSFGRRMMHGRSRLWLAALPLGGLAPVPRRLLGVVALGVVAAAPAHASDSTAHAAAGALRAGNVQVSTPTSIVRRSGMVAATGPSVGARPSSRNPRAASYIAAEITRAA